MTHKIPPFARRVKVRMRERGLGLREFCRAVGLDPSFFSKVLSGKRSPPSDEAALRRIARVLDLDAPGLIVAAGRIPLEWEGLWQDLRLFQAVHRLASGERGEPRPSASEPVSARLAPPPPSGWGTAGTRGREARREKAIPAAPLPGQAFGEELL